MNPLDALREIVINAIVHRDYSSSSDSIVKVFEDRIEVFNPGSLPPGLTVDKLLAGDYVSVIRNRKIADMFKEAGLIEKYGTGIKRILRGFADYGLSVPRFEETSGGFRVSAFRSAVVTPEVTTQVTTQVITQVTTQVDDSTLRLLQACKEPATLTELIVQIGFRSRKHFRTTYMQPALKSGLIERTVPEKPRSRLQRYRLTEKGKVFVASRKGKEP